MKHLANGRFGLLIFIILVFFACEPSSKEGDIWKEQEEQLMLEVISSREDLSITLEAVKLSYIGDLLNTYGPYTFFAPTNTAWEDYFLSHGIDSVQEVDSLLLEAIFEYHLLPLEKSSLNFENGLMDEADTTVNGDRLYIDMTAGLDQIKINNRALIQEANIEVWNGLLHVVDHVLDPPVKTIAEYLLENDDYSRFTNFLQENGLMDTLSQLRMNNYPYDRNEFSVIAISNSGMDKVLHIADSLKGVDQRYEEELARDPDYAYQVYPNQVKQYAASFIIAGTEFTANMFSSFKSTLGKIPYGDNIIKVKMKVEEEGIEVNNTTNIDLTKSDLIMRNGVIHSCSEGFAFLAESPRNFVFSTYPSDIWNTSIGALVVDSKSQGYIADDGTYGIVKLQPTAVGAKFWVDIEDVPAGDYNLTFIGKKGGSKVKIYVNGKVLDFDGTDDNSVYDFEYILGQRGRVDNLSPNPCSSSGLFLFSIPTTSFTLSQESDKVTVMLEVTYLNNNGADIELSAIILEPAVI